MIFVKIVWLVVEKMVVDGQNVVISLLNVSRILLTSVVDLLPSKCPKVVVKMLLLNLNKAAQEITD